MIECNCRNLFCNLHRGEEDYKNGQVTCSVIEGKEQNGETQRDRQIEREGE